MNSQTVLSKVLDSRRKKEEEIDEKVHKVVYE